MAKNQKTRPDGGAVKTKDILKASFKDMRKRHGRLVKVFKALLIAFAVLIVLLGATVFTLSNDSARQTVINLLIADELTDETTGITFYSEDNPEYGGDTVVLPYICYYYEDNDTSGEKIYLENGVYSDGTDKVYVSAGFLANGLQIVQNISTALKWLAAAVVLAVVILLIVCWYRSFKAQELERKRAYRKAHPRH